MQDSHKLTPSVKEIVKIFDFSSNPHEIPESFFKSNKIPPAKNGRFIRKKTIKIKYFRVIACAANLQLIKN